MSQLDRDGETIERILHAAVSRAEPEPMRRALVDAVFGGGARIRPRLCLAVARAASGTSPPLAEGTAAAIELLHCASLVHDDLPCFDNAEVRRGRPSVHRKHGEAMAVLVGDALIVAAFETLAIAGAPVRAIVALASAAGARGGLVSGQAFEFEDGVSVDAYHRAKTGGLFEIATRLGADAAGVDNEPFAAMGRKLGSFYQLADDAADVFGDGDVLGKPIRQDAIHHRPSAFAGSGTASGAEAVLHREARAVLALVPPCPGHEELRAFVAAILQKIIARSVAKRPSASIDDHRAAE